MKLNTTKIIILQGIKKKFDKLGNINCIHMTTNEIFSNLHPMLELNRKTIGTNLKGIEKLEILSRKRINGGGYTFFKGKSYNKVMKDI